MKNKIALTLIWVCCFTSIRSQVMVVTDTVYSQENLLPEGFYTLRVYVSSEHAEDAVNAVVGSAEYPLSIDIHGGDVWNHPTFGGAHSGQINCNLKAIDPALSFDSFVTIGDTC
ncbi:MAG: hypothetical protein ACKOW8_12420, partial [Flavobacteriales bacterium]